ncbi:MAG: enoyl-CoA hydratase/isomerase family protein [Deltaproteobacteria bacterium]|nr:enoyl-CoA hydratase/isomerase family protein [Deltaproteobacteria bacterium]
MIRYRKEEHVGFIEFAGKCTRWSDLDVVAAELRDIRDRVRSDEDIRVLLLSGFEKIRVPAGPESPEECEGAGPGSIGMFLQPGAEVAAFDCPTIAAVADGLLGAAVEVALACDLRIAAENATFTLPSLAAGCIPCDGGTQRLPRLVGKAKALELLLLGSTLPAPEALRIGLVNRVVNRQDLLKTVQAMAFEMASRGPIALRFAKEAVKRGVDLTIEDGLRLEADLYFLLHTTKDRSEGITAFQGRRKPQFHGE